MSCNYCGLPLAPGDTALHPICRTEVCERPAAFSSCPEGDPSACPTCQEHTNG